MIDDTATRAIRQPGGRYQVSSSADSRVTLRWITASHPM